MFSMLSYLSSDTCIYSYILMYSQFEELRLCCDKYYNSFLLQVHALNYSIRSFFTYYFRYELDTLQVTFHDELITYSDWIEVFIKWFYKSITEARAEKVQCYSFRLSLHQTVFRYHN